jgi:uncharacterized 2Fe-2S/4Fe-4S cluster protein (DUF4445 family)
MNKLVEVLLTPSGRVVRVRSASTLEAVLREAGIEIDLPCGGKGKCHGCKVEAAGELTPLSDVEKEARLHDGLRSGQRLACQARVLGKTTVRVPWDGIIQVLEQGCGWALSPLDPNVRRIMVEMAPPGIESQTGDRERLENALARAGIKCFFALPVLTDLGKKVRDYGVRFAVTMIGDEVVELGPGDAEPALGMAFDIGTTTVVGYLMDLATGRELAVTSALNPQGRYGFDVISRIAFAIEEDNGLETLSRLIRDLMNQLIQAACERVQKTTRNIYEVSVAGNAAMIHLLLGIDPHYLALAPYVPVTTASVTTKAAPLGLKIHPEGSVYVLPGIGGFVGADTTGMIMATRFHRDMGPALAIDIGTNGEVVGRDATGKMMALSTAAGPAFEGGRISSGARGINGAIQRVRLSGSRLFIETIGKVKPIGICGSGLIDTLAIMRQAGVLTKSGELLLPTESATGRKSALARHVNRSASGTEFVLVQRNRKEGRIAISQKDIRELQLAKGAIAAGIRIMLGQMGVNENDLQEVLLAGAFGNYIETASAQSIGLLPKVPVQILRQVGNAAGQGAKSALISKSVRAEAEKITRRVRVINLARMPDFQKVFLESMSFG